MKRYDPMKISATLQTLFALVFFQFVASASEPRKGRERDMVFVTLEELESMIKEGADVNSFYSREESLVSDVAFMRDTEALKRWIELGADINTVNKAGYTPLFSAIAVSNVPVVNLLIRHGAKLDHRDEYGRIPLHLAIAGLCGPHPYHPQLAIDLINAGSFVNALDAKGISPLNLLRLNKGNCNAGGKDNKLEKLLLSKGAVDVSGYPWTSSK